MSYKLLAQHDVNKEIKLLLLNWSQIFLQFYVCIDLLILRCFGRTGEDVVCAHVCLFVCLFVTHHFVCCGGASLAAVDSEPE